MRLGAPSYGHGKTVAYGETDKEYEQEIINFENYGNYQEDKAMS